MVTGIIYDIEVKVIYNVFLKVKGPGMQAVAH
jgi:hypothetical protein